MEWIYSFLNYFKVCLVAVVYVFVYMRVHLCVCSCVHMSSHDILSVM